MKYNNETISMNQATELVNNLKNSSKTRMVANPHNPLVIKLDYIEGIYAEHVGTFEELTDAQENTLLGMADETVFGRYW